MRLERTINPAKIALIMGIVAVFLALQSIFSEYLLETFTGIETDSLLALVLDVFSVNLEESIPTWYSTIILFIAANILMAIAVMKRNNRDPFAYYWIGLAVLFFYLSLDEGAVIHEIIADPLQELFNTGGYLAFGWQIVAVPLVIVFGLIYVRFLLHLPSHTRNLFILAGSLYAGGALFVEGISANQWAQDGGTSMTYLGIATIEESFEMLGVVVFIYSLLAYIVDSQYTFAFQSQVRSPTRAQTPIDEIHTTTDHQNDELANHSHVYSFRIFHAFQPLHWVVLIVALIVLVANLALFYLASGKDEVSATDIQNSFVLQAIVNELATDEVLVVRLTDTFGPESTPSRQVVASLFEIFDEVSVVTLSSPPSSIAFAADTLPFDRNTLIEVLRTNGETQFAIFDSPTVRLIVGD